MSSSPRDGSGSTTLPSKAPESVPDSKAQPRLPVLPLRGHVPLPGSPMPIMVGRAPSLAAVHAAQGLGDELVLVMQRDASVDEPEAADLHPVGVLGRILRVIDNGTDGGLTLIVAGAERVELRRVEREDRHLVADVEIVTPPRPPDDVVVQALVQTLRRLTHQLVALSPGGNPEFAMLVDRTSDPGGVADILAAGLDISREEKQQVLETFDIVARLERVARLAGKAVEVLELGKRIETQVHGQLEETKRQHLLREQMKAIRNELGEGDDPELARLRAQREDADLSEEAAKVVDREFSRLEAIGPASPERAWIVNYLEWMLDLPWTRMSEVESNLASARAVLDREHHGLDKVKERIMEALAVRRLNPEGRSPILCFVGPPGVGKTSLAHAVAEATRRELVRISVGGVSDESEIRGHRRTYVGAMPGRFLAALRKAGTRNPVFVVDEIDKMVASFHGDPAAALLEVLDPEQNSAFVDRYIEVPFDLSRVLFIATANTLEGMPRPLRDRLEIIEIPSYTHQEKLAIAKGHLVPRQIAQAGLRPEDVSITDEALDAMLAGWTRESGVRELERRIAAVLRKIALRVAEGERGPWTVGALDLEKALGRQRFFDEAVERMCVPGIAMGLAWSPTGGSVLFIEVSRKPGKGALKLTGQLGEVMRESAEAALTWILARPERFEGAGEHDYHVHVPAGATPKDGPSAGAAILTALASLATGRRVKHDLAMTGEITLRGQVLPVGGMREKVLAASRAGVRTVILPARNEPDLDDVPEEVRSAMSFVSVSRSEEILEAALEEAVMETADAGPDPTRR